MTVHAFQLFYAPSEEMDGLVSSFLDVADDWSKEELDYPSERVFGRLDSDVSELRVSGFSQNRFEWQNSQERPVVDAEQAVKGLVDNVKNINDYTDWWVLKWHMCDHDGDENHGCGYFNSNSVFEGGWKILLSSEDYGFSVPGQVK
jgi:hypothetical protein